MQKFEIKNHIPIYSWLGMDSPDEWETLKATEKIAILPWVYHHVSLMGDAHIGIGATVGSVIAMKNAVSPAAVGSDQGCGMAAIKYNLKAEDLPESLSDLRLQIEQVVPVGFNSRKDSLKIVHDNPLWKRFDQLTSKVQNLKGKALSQCGSLGGGNHFIELCLDTENNLWLMLHSGSRNIGKVLADQHINIAKNLVHNKNLEDKNIAVLLAETPEFISFVSDLTWAQEYAFLNREAMLFSIDLIIKNYFNSKLIIKSDPILCHHNYLSKEKHFGEMVYVTRKGAINAEKGKMGIIPGSMGTQSFIVRGLGNPDSFNSAPHGAGRRMSRGGAKKKFTLDDLREQTKGVECRKERGVLDEIPGAYKSIQSVMENSKDLVEVVAELKQVLCIKG